jgi:predicted nuclease of restriction endonuclease-like (RecB) superfamily
MKTAPSVRSLHLGIRKLVLSARESVARSVDLLQVYTNYEIGRRIVEQEQKGTDRAEYGANLLNELSALLSAEFGNGFSRTNLEYMRRLYLTFPDRGLPISQTTSGKLGKGASSGRGSRKSAVLPISQTSSGKLTESVDSKIAPRSADSGDSSLQRQFTLSWSHYVFLLGLEENERNFYEIEAGQQGWTLQELKRQFNAGLYERLALSRDKDSVRALSRKGQRVARAEDFLKNPLVLEFLGLEEKASYTETDLEMAIVSHIENFLLELGKGFLLEARQKRFTFEEEHYFVDLVLYNRLLRCYVLVDLKIGKLAHQDLGQMQMYVNYYDRFVREEEENPTIGILLCKRNNQAMLEITLPKDANIRAREYQLYLPSKRELQRKLTEWIDRNA